MHSIIENMEHCGNTHYLLTKHVGILNSKQIQIQVLNALRAPNSAESVWISDPQHIYG